MPSITRHAITTALITDKNGSLVVAEKFAALGWNENTSAEEATMATITRHEFTGQEGLDNNGLDLVDLNGRIYFASGSRILSPDPYIQDPTNTQSYDRYSYVMNNPLSAYDPSGFCGISVQATYTPGGLYPTSEGDFLGGMGVVNGTWSFTYIDSPCEPPLPPGFLGGRRDGANGGNSSGQTPSRALPQQTECPAPASTGSTATSNAESPAIPITETPPLVGPLVAALGRLSVLFAALSISGDTYTQYVIRGGLATPQNLMTGSTPVPGTNLSGFSVTTAPDMSVTQLAAVANYPNAMISYTTTAALQGIGVPVVPTPSAANALHATAVVPVPLDPTKAAQISAAFARIPNPSRCGAGGG